MRDRGKIRKIFPGGNTRNGFHSFFDYITGDNYNKRYIIKGGPGAGKSTFMSRIGRHMLEYGFDLEQYHCPTDPDSLDAIAIPELGVALLDGTAPHVVEPRNPGITDHIIWLGDYWDQSKLMESKDEILELNRRADKLFRMAFSCLKEAGVAYDEWKSYAQDDFNEQEYQKALRQVMDDIYKDSLNRTFDRPRHSHFFAAAISGKGVYNFTDGLIEPAYKVYAFSGMPGSGVRRAIGRIVQQAEELGIRTQQFHCPIDIGELDLVIMPELKSVVVNTDQLLGGNSSPSDYKHLVSHINFDDFLNYRTICQFAQEIEQSKDRFHHLINRAIDFISRAKATHGQIEKYYIDAMDFQRVDGKRAEVLQDIMKLINNQG
ncbi:MAG: hypothetical protein GX375_10085 [Clostridiales bacterium]|nr:hypothetical protein [Clostridiales bacterium]